MLTTFNKYKLNVLVILLFSIVLKLLSLGVQKLVFLTDIDYVNAIIQYSPKQPNSEIGIDLGSLLNLQIISGFAGVFTLLITSIYFGYQINKYRFHWLNSLLSLLLTWGITFYSNSKKGWHTDINFGEIPGYLFKVHPYQYFLFNNKPQLYTQSIYK